MEGDRYMMTNRKTERWMDGYMDWQADIEI
jgi:hypothetical protein